LHGLPGEPRWTLPERWHLTLLFLGAVPADRVGGLVVAAGAVVAVTSAMHLRLTGGGRFGSRRRPQVAWTGLGGGVRPLTGLAGRLADAARSLGLPVEDRPFRAHLTIGRWRPGRPADGSLTDRLGGYSGPAWPVTEVLLLRSYLGASPRYETVATWPLG
jgi:2'-5' RNA ligase